MKNDILKQRHIRFFLYSGLTSGFLFLFVNLCFLIFACNAKGGLNLKNGNFYITYTDFTSPTRGQDEFKGGFEIVRTYNSKATSIGNFGYGWGSEYETSLKPDFEGGMKLDENGSGAERWLTETNPSKSLESSLHIVGMAGISTYGPNSTHVQTYLKRLHDSAPLRVSAYTKASQLGVIEARPLPPDWSHRMSIFCTDPGCSEDHGFLIERTLSGYRRKEFSGGVDEFDVSMRLVLKQKPNGYFVRIVRDSEGRVLRYQDANGYRLNFQTDDERRIIGLRDSLGRTAEYRYEGSKLVMSRDVAGNVYMYEYDDLTNMTQISYMDGSTLKVEYNSKSMATRVQQRNGEIETYEYGEDPKNPNLHYWTIVKRYDVDGELTEDNKYEWEYGLAKSGVNYLKRMLIERKLQGEREESIYSQEGLLISKEVNGHVTEYE